MAYDDAENTVDDEQYDSDADLKRFGEWDKAIRETWGPWRIEAKMAYGMVAGDQWDDDSKADLEEQLIAPVSWNRIQPLVDAVSGAQIQNRHELKFFPREMGDIGVNELLTSAAQWAADESDFEDEETDAFFDVLVCGLGWTEMRMDYEENPDGEIRKDRIDPLELAVDPSAKKRNLADMQYLRRERAYTKEQFKERFPDWKEYASGTNTMDEPGRGHSHSGDDYDIEDEDAEERRRGDIFVKEYQWYDLEYFWRLIDPTTQQETQLSDDDYARFDERMKAMGSVGLNGVRVKRRVYQRAFCVEGRVLEKEILPDEGFTYHCITGKRDRNNGTWYGLVRAMVDPQRWANKWLTQILVIVNKNAKGGVLVESDAVEDMRQFEEDYALPDAVTQVNPGALAQGKVQEKPQVQYPQGLDRLVNMAVTSIRDVTGINQEMLGQADRTQPGIVETQRREAGYAMLAMFFDSLRRYRKISGRMLLRYIQNYISDGRLIRVVGNEGGQKYVPLMRDESMKDYDVIVDESPTGPNQKEKVWGMLVQMLPILRGAGLPPTVWAELIRYSPMPEALSEKITKAISAPPSPQQQQAQAMQQQLMMANAQAEIAKTHSETAENQADAQETIARMHKLMAEKRHQEVETMLTQMLGGFKDSSIQIHT